MCEPMDDCDLEEDEYESFNAPAKIAFGLLISGIILAMAFTLAIK